MHKQNQILDNQIQAVGNRQSRIETGCLARTIIGK